VYSTTNDLYHAVVYPQSLLLINAAISFINNTLPATSKRHHPDFCDNCRITRVFIWVLFWLTYHDKLSVGLTTWAFKVFGKMGYKSFVVELRIY